MCVSALNAGESDVYSSTRLDFNLIQEVIEGKDNHWIDFETVSLDRGVVFHIKPDQIHSFEPRSRHEAL